MGVAFLHGNGGGGANLNFEVKAYASEDNFPSTAKENTIAVITDEMTSWVFSSVEPETPVDNMVWIETGASSAVSFNALKKNGIYIYPISAKQYIDGSWVDKTAKSFQNGGWVDWWIPGTLFANGTDDTNLTGGWASFAYSAGSGYAAKTVDVNVSSNGVSATLDATATHSTFIGTNNKVSVSDYNSLKMEFSEATRSSSNGAIRMVLYSDAGYTTAAECMIIATDGAINLSPEIDVSELSGEYYIGYFMWAWNACVLSATMTTARLSK